MIEQSVSLASNGVVKVPGYEQLVRFGYTKNRGVYRLHVDATGEWEGLTIRCFWHVPDGKDPASSLVVDGYVAVPASVTAQPGSGCVTFEGSDGAKVMTSADLRYRVSANSGTQDGTPMPDAPVPIVSAGDSGSVAVKVTGANMLEGTKPGVKSTVNGITYTTYENGVLITGTATNAFTISLHADMKLRLTRGIYYLTTRGLSSSAMLNFYFIGKFSSDVQNREVDLTRDVDFSLVLQILKGATLNTTVQVSLTRNKITAYSPYREQLLTLPTPTGLPGIPVTSGGNYTDQSGQQWVCDEVDLTRGVRVQRIYKVDVDGENVKFEQAGEYCNLTQRNLPAALYEVGEKAYCISTLSSLSWYFNKDYFFLYLIAANSADQFNESCKKQLGKIYYALATPIETPLTPDEIAAYKALTAYGPDTVVQAGDGAGVKLVYQRDVNIAIKKLEDAVASMTAN